MIYDLLANASTIKRIVNLQCGLAYSMYVIVACKLQHIQKWFNLFVSDYNNNLFS
jgi:hypothetical protein